MPLQILLLQTWNWSFSSVKPKIVGLENQLQATSQCWTHAGVCSFDHVWSTGVMTEINAAEGNQVVFKLLFLLSSKGPSGTSCWNSSGPEWSPLAARFLKISLQLSIDISFLHFVCWLSVGCTVLKKAFFYFNVPWFEVLTLSPNLKK